jgi:hypothetical protein
MSFNWPAFFSIDRPDAPDWTNAGDAMFFEAGFQLPEPAESLVQSSITETAIAPIVDVTVQEPILLNFISAKKLLA